MSQPADQRERDRFTGERTRNFSVIAAAGSGKTRAITDRIIAIAQSTHALEWLPSLVVVTFTNRAADEMQQRARQSLLEAGVPLDVLAAFNRAFFGTIHSFCVKLLHQHGHHLGLAGQFETANDDDLLWMEFVQQHTAVAASLGTAEREALLRLVPVRQLMELGRGGGCAGFAAEPGPFPRIDFHEVYNFTPDKRSQAAVERSQQNLRRWEDTWKTGSGFEPLPACESKPLGEAWREAVGPIREWAGRCALRVAADVERAYRDFRIARGVLGYDDQVALALELMRHPEAAPRIRAKNYRVILDEAQDTDPSMFDVLLEITRPPDASGAWLDVRDHAPRAGHFCMVGDFQQSIYSDRADLAHYQLVHEALVASEGGEKVEFSVTFRLDERQIAFVNETFPELLNGRDDQACYVQLQPRPAVLPGQVVRWEPKDLPPLDGLSDARKARLEAPQLARWLREQSLGKLRASAWSQVAILCPRKEWFRPLRDALRAEGFAVQLQSERDVKGDSPAYAWFTALAVAMAEPDNGYEIVGVLREVFGLSDHNLAVFAEGKRGRFQITEPTQREGTVGDTLRLLAELRARLADQPLFSAMRELVGATLLRDRLRTLPDEEYEGLDAELDELLTLAAAAEPEEQTLVDFANGLRDGMATTREVRGTTGDAVQLITGHKAKGSEWQCVVVPFLARSVLGGRSNYPRLLHIGGKVRAAFSREDIDAETDATLKARDRQVAERLLYVALTRSRHTLVLADDLDLFRLKKGVAESGQASVLRCAPKKDNADAFAALPTQCTACAATVAQESERDARKVGEQAVEPLAAVAGGIVPAAAERATHFIKRNPSALAEAALADADPAAYLALAPRGAVQSLGQRYGTWWHGLVEHLDWQAGATAWDAVFESSLATSPDVELSRREWKLLWAQLTSDTPLARLLTAPGLVLHAEMPFLWRMNERDCLEGIIDLAVFDPTAGTWLLVDWKTNRQRAEELPAHYEPQLAAYWKAVSEMTGAPVHAGLFATASSTWLPYESASLAAAWERLAVRPDAISRALETE